MRRRRPPSPFDKGRSPALRAGEGESLQEFHFTLSLSKGDLGQGLATYSAACQSRRSTGKQEMTENRKSAKELIEIESRLGAHNYHPLDVVLTRGEGIWVWDVDGKRYMDCLSAYSAVNQGHCHPKIHAALVEQAARLPLTSRAFRNDQLPLFYEEICTLTKSHKVLPMNSGAEAVETAIKAVRKWGYEVKGVPEDQAEVIVCEEGFHGRTITIVGFSTDQNARQNFGPLAPGFTVIPYGDAAALEQAITARPG